MNRCGTMGFHSKLIAFSFFILGTFVMAASSSATLIVNDSWTDAGRTNGPDSNDSNWWTSSSTAGIEVSAGSLGMVTGTTGRGIHTIFPTQTLSNIGDSLVATYTFKTPATVGAAQSGGFRVGLFDTLGRSGLDADVTSSSGSPNSLYGLYSTSTVALPGYMMDMDVGTGTEDFNFRQLETAVNTPQQTPTGRLMGTATGFTSIANGPDGVYSFAPNTTYTGSLTLTRINATDLQLTGTLGAASFTATDTFDSASYGMLAFWANSNVFGSSSTAGQADNGIDFSNAKIEFNPVPEPISAGVFGVTSLLLALCRGNRKRR